MDSDKYSQIESTYFVNYCIRDRDTYFVNYCIRDREYIFCQLLYSLIKAWIQINTLSQSYMFINHVLSYPLRDREYIFNQLLYQLGIESIYLYSLYLASLHHVVGRCDLNIHACFNYVCTRMHVDLYSLTIIYVSHDAFVRESRYSSSITTAL